MYDYHCLMFACNYEAQSVKQLEAQFSRTTKKETDFHRQTSLYFISLIVTDSAIYFGKSVL